jgi:kynurenine formamidase
MVEDSDSGEKGSVHMRIIDLSQEIYNGMPQRFFAGPVPSVFDSDTRRTSDYQAVDDCCVLQNHLGTHVDAPRHYDPQTGLAMHQIPLEHFVTHAVVLDLRHKSARSEITVADLEQAMTSANENVGPSEGVLLHVGMGKKYRTWTNEQWWESEYGQAPYLGEEGVQWLLGKRISILGIDAIAPDAPGDRPAHRILLRDHKIPIIENLCNLEKLSRPRVLLIALPPKVVGASGFPVRAVAIEE